MPKCSCAGQTCACSVIAGTGTTVTGTGTSADPFVVAINPQGLSIGSAIAVAAGPTNTVRLTKSGSGGTSDPVVLSADVIVNAPGGTKYTFSVSDSGVPSTNVVGSSSVAWTGSGGGGGTASDASSTSKGVIQLAGDLTGSAAVPALVTTGVTAGSYGSATVIPVITVDGKGRLTAASGAPLAAYSPLRVSTRSVTSAAYSFAVADANSLVVEASSSSAQTLTVATAASAGWTVGDVLEVAQFGTGQVSLAFASGVTVQNPYTTTNLRAQFSSATLRYRGSDTWLLQGDVT